MNTGKVFSLRLSCVWVLLLGFGTSLFAQQGLPRSVVGSTFFGGFGTDEIRGVAVHPSGDIIAVGLSDSWELAQAHGAQIQGGSDAFVVRLDPFLEEVISATFLGGFGNDAALCLAIASDGTVIVGGYTESPKFPVSV